MPFTVVKITMTIMKVYWYNYYHYSCHHHIHFHHQHPHSQYCDIQKMSRISHTALKNFILLGIEEMLIRKTTRKLPATVLRLLIWLSSHETKYKSLAFMAHLLFSNMYNFQEYDNIVKIKNTERSLTLS